jgi:thymidylate kinase
VKIYFDDLGYLELDLIHRFDRKGIIYLDIQEVLSESIVNNYGYKTAAPHHQYIYIVLFYLMNGTDVPERYRSFFAAMDAATRRSIFTWITAKYDVHINTLEDLFIYNNRHRKKLITRIYKSKTNRFPLKWKHQLEYIMDSTRGIIHERGITITFTGVDGAGKSTILQSVQQQLKEKYRLPVKVLRHRPSLLPILSSVKYGKKGAEQKAASTLPRQGTNNNTVSSLFRFMYYYSDYLLGRFYVYCRYNIRGITVLYDRYYFDFIVDGKRSNISINPGMARVGYNLVSKPELNFFLYAPAEEILKRKQELNETDIRTMTHDYRALFDKLSHKYPGQQYISIDNRNLDETMNTVMKHIISTH